MVQQGSNDEDFVTPKGDAAKIKASGDEDFVTPESDKIDHNNRPSDREGTIPGIEPETDDEINEKDAYTSLMESVLPKTPEVKVEKKQGGIPDEFMEQGQQKPSSTRVEKSSVDREEMEKAAQAKQTQTKNATEKIEAQLKLHSGGLQSMSKEDVENLKVQYQKAHPDIDKSIFGNAFDAAFGSVLDREKQKVRQENYKNQVENYSAKQVESDPLNAKKSDSKVQEEFDNSVIKKISETALTPTEKDLYSFIQKREQVLKSELPRKDKMEALKGLDEQIFHLRDTPDLYSYSSGELLGADKMTTEQKAKEAQVNQKAQEYFKTYKGNLGHALVQSQLALEQLERGLGEQSTYSVEGSAITTKPTYGQLAKAADIGGADGSNSEVKRAKELAKQRDELYMEREALKKAYLLNKSSDHRADDGFFNSVATTLVENLPGGKEFKSNTSDLNYAKQIWDASKVYELPVTKEMEEATLPTTREELGAGTGQIIKTLPKFIAAAAVTEGVGEIAGLGELVSPLLEESAPFLDKVVGHTIKSIEEGVKFQASGAGDFEGGAGFYAGGTAFGKFDLPFKPTGFWGTAMKVFANYAIKQGIGGGAAGMTGAGVAESLVQSLTTDKSFQEAIDEHFGDTLDKKGKAVLANLATGLIIGFPSLGGEWLDVRKKALETATGLKENGMAADAKNIMQTIGQADDLIEKKKKESEKPVAPKEATAPKPKPEVKPEEINKHIQDNYQPELADIDKRKQSGEITTEQATKEVEKLKEKASKELSDKKKEDVKPVEEEKKPNPTKSKGKKGTISAQQAIKDFKEAKRIREGKSKRDMSALKAGKQFRKDMTDFKPQNISEFVRNELAHGQKFNSKERTEVFKKGSKESDYLFSDNAPSLDEVVLRMEETYNHDYGHADQAEIRAAILEEITDAGDKKDLQDKMFKLHEERKFQEEHGMTKEMVDEANHRYEIEQAYVKHYQLDKAEEEEAHHRFDEIDNQPRTKEELDADAAEYDEWFKNQPIEIQEKELASHYGTETTNEGGEVSKDPQNKSGSGDSGETPEKRRERLEREVADKKAISDKASADYEAEKKSLDKDLKAKQGGLFEGKQQKLIDDTEEKSKVVDDLKKKADTAKSEYEKAQNLLDEELKGQKDLFDEAEKDLKDLPPPVALGFTGKDLGKAVKAITTIANSLIEKGAATIQNVWEKVKEYLKGLLPGVKDAQIEKMKEAVMGGVKEPPVSITKMLLEGKSAEEIDAEFEKREATLNRVKEILEKQKSENALSKLIKPDDIIKTLKELGTKLLGEHLDSADEAKAIIRARNGKKNEQLEIIQHANEKLLHFWNNIPAAYRSAFILSMENPKKYGESDPKFKSVVEAYRARLDKAFDMIAQIKDLPYIEDYFPHFWKDPEKAKTVIASIHGKSPLEGNKSFLKKRFYADILAGMEAGLKLATDNPEELVQLAETNAWRFKTAHDIFQDFNSKGLLKYFKPGEAEEGWKPVDDPMFKRLGLFVTKEGTGQLDIHGNEETKAEAHMTTGGYYMPEEAARVVNSYLSPGFYGKLGKAARTIRGYNNIKNLFQLGVGVFHFTTTSIDATVTGGAIALQELSALQFAKGTTDLVKALTVLPNLIETFNVGDKAIKARRTGNFGDDTENLAKVNGNTGLAKMYTLDAVYNAKKAWANVMRGEGEKWELPKAIINSVFVAPELVGKPLMEYYVPRLKVGGFLRTFETELALNPDMTEAQKDKARLQAWDNMDNRLGQVVYDNIFWDKTIKDLAFMSIRSQGWTIGTIKALGGGALDIPESVKRASQGKGITQRTAWAIMLPIQVGLMGGMYQWAMSGKKPDKLDDYFFPLDGTKNADGTDHRVSLPSYMKDLFAYKKDWLQTLGHKTAPTINEVVELLSNKDFYGVEIANHDDKWYKQGLEYLRYEFETLVPFSFKQKNAEGTSLLKQLSTRQGLEQKFGLMPAMADFGRTPLQEKIAKLSQDNFGNKRLTPEEAEQQGAKRQIRDAIHKGIDWSHIPKDLKDKAKIDPDKLDAFITSAIVKDPYERKFKYLHNDQKEKLFKTMGKEEKAKYQQYMPEATGGGKSEDMTPEEIKEQKEESAAGKEPKEKE